MAKPTTINIVKPRGDTRRHVFTISDADTEVAIDVSLWSSFRLVVNTERQPTDATNVQETMTGAFVTDGTDGRVYFVPAGTLAIGTYYYDAEALDNNGERFTFASGSYRVNQDIAK